MASFSNVPNSQLSDLPIDLVGMIALQTNSLMDVMDFVFAGKPIYSDPTVKFILDIMRFCSMKGERVHHILILAAPPTATCADSIIESIGHLFIQALIIADVPMTLDGAHSIASIVSHTKLLDLTIFRCRLTSDMLTLISNVLAISKLTSLVHNSNRIGAMGAIGITAALSESNLSLLDLY